MSDQRSNHATDRFKSYSSLADDLLRGADDIALFVFGDVKHRRKVYYYGSDGKVRLPVFRIGNAICARKSTLSCAGSRSRRAVGERTHGLAWPAKWMKRANTITARPLGSKRAKAASPRPSAHARRTPARRAGRSQ